MSTSKRVTSESHLGSPTWFELDRFGAQSEVSGKTSTKAVFGRGKAKTVANLGASGGGD
jgi:hypothetical protein